MTSHDRLLNIIEELCVDMHLHLIELEVKGDKSRPLYQVYVDSAEGITLGECGQLSRAIQDEIDFNDAFPQKYRLDVSSPGLDKPLIKDFQYKRNIGKEITFLFEDGKSKKNIVGFLKSFDTDSLVIETDKGKETGFPRTAIR